MKKTDFDYFQNKQCKYFPCHSYSQMEDFNCLFCYCPLYGLKEKCGGNFVYLKNGIKDCSSCTIPHTQKGYDYIQAHGNAIIELGKKEGEEYNENL